MAAKYDTKLSEFVIIQFGNCEHSTLILPSVVLLSVEGVEIFSSPSYLLYFTNFGAYMGHSMSTVRFAVPRFLYTLKKIVVVVVVVVCLTTHQCHMGYIASEIDTWWEN